MTQNAETIVSNANETMELLPDLGAGPFVGLVLLVLAAAAYFVFNG